MKEKRLAALQAQQNFEEQQRLREEQMKISQEAEKRQGEAEKRHHCNATGGSEENSKMSLNISNLSMKEYIDKRIKDIADLKNKVYTKKAVLDECRGIISELQFHLTQANARVSQEKKQQVTWNHEDRKSVV
jgi:hypothetical protein